MVTWENNRLVEPDPNVLGQIAQLLAARIMADAETAFRRSETLTLNLNETIIRALLAGIKFEREEQQNRVCSSCGCFSQIKELGSYWLCSNGVDFPGDEGDFGCSLWVKK